MSPAIPDLRDTPSAIDFYDDRFEQGYMGDWSDKKRQRVEALVRALRLPPTGHALDFGCGVGMFSEVLAAALPGWTIEGTDLSPKAVELASRRLPTLTFFPLAQSDGLEGRYNLIFTHHV